MHGDQRLLKSPRALFHHRPTDRVSSPLVARHEPIVARRVGPGQPRQFQICFDSGMTAVSGGSVFLDHVGAFFRGHNDGRVDIRRRHGWKN